MQTRSVLSLVAVVSASVVIGAIVAEGAAAPKPAASAAGDPAHAAPSSTGSHAGSRPAPATSSTARPSARPTTPADVYSPPAPGRYTYSGPGGDTVTRVTVTPAGPDAWRLDESVVVPSALVQRRQEAWSSDGERVLAVWEAGQAQPCVWSNPPTSVAFPVTAASTWSVDTSCRVVNGSTGQSVTHVQGAFRTTGPVRLTIAGHVVRAWLVKGTEVTTVDGSVRGHRYHTVDRTTTRVWFLPSVGLPGRTELTGTVAITTEKGTTRHRIGQVTQLKSLTPQ